MATSAVPKKSRSQNKPTLADTPRVMIECVTPQVDDGTYPVKRVVGDVVAVGADIYKDGHDLIAARVAYRGPNDRTDRTAPLTHDFNPDRWTGDFSVDAVGRWHFTIEAWADLFATWRNELKKKYDAGQDVLSELLEGAALVERASAGAKAADRKKLETAAATLRNNGAPLQNRVTAAISDELAALMAAAGPLEPVTRYHKTLGLWVDRQRAGFAAWYELFPRSQGSTPGKHATFRDAERRLADLADLGFDVLYLPPIHPVGVTKRKGRNNTLVAGPKDPGSPWAIGGKAGGHTAIEPLLGTIADFEHFVSAARTHGMEVALDFALQCSPDHPWLGEHPEWFFVRPDGTLKYAENPPKKYEDIYPLNFWCENHETLWEACRDIVVFWMEHGVKTFRVDNPHTKPLAFWEWLIADIHDRDPDIVFLAEAFTRPKRMKGLAKLGFTQSYTYFTWRNTPEELRTYLEELAHTDTAEYFRPNFFANTPDILHEYLQHGGRSAFRIRLVLAATLSPVYGIYSGFELCENVPVQPGSEEYLDSEKYEIRVRDWQADGHIRDDVRCINHARRAHPALQKLTNISFHPSENEHFLFYLKSSAEGDILVIVNLDPHHAQETMVHVPIERLGVAEDGEFQVEDLLSGDTYTWRGRRNYVRLDPAVQVAHVFRVQRGTGGEATP